MTNYIDSIIPFKPFIRPKKERIVIQTSQIKVLEIKEGQDHIGGGHEGPAPNLLRPQIFVCAEGKLEISKHCSSNVMYASRFRSLQ